jgi:hypothetical protein
MPRDPLRRLNVKVSHRRTCKLCGEKIPKGENFVHFKMGYQGDAGICKKCFLDDEIKSALRDETLIAEAKMNKEYIIRGQCSRCGGLNFKNTELHAVYLFSFSVRLCPDCVNIVGERLRAIAIKIESKKPGEERRIRIKKVG